MYVLVLLTERPDAVGPVPDHEPFIDLLIERELVMLGGPAEGGEAAAAYVLRCDSLAEAHEVVAADPLVRSGAMTASVSRWDLVGIDPRLIDRDLVVGEEGP
jgi:uncharacterized protein YciI